MSEETAAEVMQERRGLEIVRLRIWGPASVVFTVPPSIRSQLGVVAGDALGIRVRVIQGRRFLICERIALHQLAKLPEVPVDVLRKIGGEK